jgi:hypothetical protein
MKSRKMGWEKHVARIWKSEVHTNILSGNPVYVGDLEVESSGGHL